METKKEFKIFTIFEHKKEEEYLRRQHQAGWRFVKVSGLGVYQFEKCPPEDVVYQLDYNKDADREEYLRMFSDCGWEYIQDYVGYSYFRKSAADMNGAEEIFSDDSSRLAMMERVYKGRLLPLLVIFCTILVPQLIINIMNGHYVMAVFFGGMFGVYLAVFCYCAVHYYRQKK